MRPYLLAGPAVALVAAVIAGPIVFLFRMSLCEPARGRGFYAAGTWTLANFADVFAAPDVLAFTVGFAVAVAVVSIAVAYPLALFVRGLPPTWRAVALAAVLLPKTAGSLAVLFGVQQMLPRGRTGAVLAEAYLVVPYAVLVLVVQLAAIDPALTTAARGLGATRCQAFRRVTLPLSLPGLLLSAHLGLMWGLGAVFGPLFLGGPAETTLGIEVYRQAFDYGRWPRAAATGVVLLALIAAASALLPRRTP